MKACVVKGREAVPPRSELSGRRDRLPGWRGVDSLKKYGLGAIECETLGGACNEWDDHRALG